MALIKKEDILREIETLQKELLTDYKKKYYNDEYISEYNLLNQFKKIIISKGD